MVNIWDKELIHTVYEWDAEQVVYYHNRWKEMMSDNPVFVNTIAQYWGNQFIAYSLADAFVYDYVKIRMDLSILLFLQIPTISPPFGDKKVDKNNQILAALPKPIKGEFFGGAGENDGYIKWEEPILMNVMKITEEGELIGAKVVVQPTQIPLEVGYTSSGTTWAHLIRARSLARLPYGQNRIHIWYNTEPMKPLFQLWDKDTPQEDKQTNMLEIPEHDFATDWMPFGELERFV